MSDANTSVDTPVKACRGPEFCMDDLCRNSERGLCGIWRNDEGDRYGQYPDDEWYDGDDQ